MPDRTPRILLVTPASPWAPSSGTQQRTALLYDALAELMPVDVLLLEEGGADEAVSGDRPEILAKVTWKQPFVPYKYGVNMWVDDWCESNIDMSKYALVVSRYFTPGTKIAWPRRMRTMVDCDDAHYRYVPRFSSFPFRALAAARGWIRILQTRAAMSRYDHAFFCAPRDRDLFLCRSNSILPNVVHLPQPPAASGLPGTVLFVGSMWYPPNRQGVEWFLKYCWPEIAERCPGLTFRIVGPAPPGDRERWQRAVRTEAPGFVDDLGAEYARALFTIAPIHYGGGTCIKFLESAAFLRACVVSEHVFRGYESDFRDGFSVAVARDARSMTQECVALFEDAARRSAIAGEAHETVKRLYTVERFRRTVQNAVRGLLASPRRSDDAS